jgi:hypothetical protein
MTAPQHSPAPWSYEYSPYRARRGQDGVESELAAFEIFDGDCNKVFDTNEDTPCELQEANARMAAAAPALLQECHVNANVMMQAADWFRERGYDDMAIALLVRSEMTSEAIAKATGRAA